ncbi:MAG: ribonuclease HI family protein [candidate division WOR-3 bacterium]|nr:MAG: ribonuclease HI family protein [candidate division WOR-3 bacterium]
MAVQKEPRYCIYVDGSSRGNPGPAGVGVAVFEAEKEDPSTEISKYIGLTTNNVAEYEAVIHAIKWMTESGVRQATVKLDSELVYKQLTGKYRIKSPHIKLLIKRINTLKSQIDEVIFVLIPREENKRANRLAQKASKKIKVKHQKFKQLPLS